jgi:hypothetical protein
MTEATLESVWQTGAAFLDGYTAGDAASGGPGKFLCALQPGANAGLGATLSVLLRFVDREAEFHVHARVVERRESRLRLEFLAEEKGREELVVACARGESVAYHRRARPRIPCDLAARVGASSARVVHISSRGLQVSVDGLNRFAIDHEVRLTVDFEGGPQEVRARVAAVLAEGPQTGLGLEFLFDSAAQRDAVADQVAILAAREARRHL